jgi:DNA-binding LacI/PurR family transcriptional regulator
MAKTKSMPTLEDLAAHADVSVATVSRVINRSGPVSKELEVRVKEAMKALGKEKSRPAVVVCIIQEVMNPSFATAVTGMQEEAEKLDIHLVLVPISENSDNLWNLNVLKYMTIDGVILHHIRIQPEVVLDLCNNLDVPMIVLRKCPAVPQIHCIDVDREGGMYQATKFLLNLNHRDIAYLSGPSEPEFSKARLRGIEKALTEANLTLQEDFHRGCLPTIDDGFRVTSNLLHLPEGRRPTAILAYNDLVAVGALHAIRNVGLKVPDDISVIGFDNIYLSSHTNPPLTTVAQPHYQKGQVALQKLSGYLKGYQIDPGGLTLLECSLVVRESTGLCNRA